MANPVMKPGTWSGERPMRPNVASAQSAVRAAARREILRRPRDEEATC